MTKCLLTLSNWIQKFLQGILLIIGTLLTAVNIAQIVGREIHFSLPWSEQLSTWLLIWTIFLGYHLVIKNDAELTIDAIHFKNHTAQLLLEILRDFLSLTMIVVFLIASTQFLQNSMIYPQKLGLRIAKYESVPSINFHCLFPRQFAEAIHVFQFHNFSPLFSFISMRSPSCTGFRMIYDKAHANVYQESYRYISCGNKSAQLCI